MEAEVALGWIADEVRWNVYESLRRRYGAEQFEQEAYVFLCESARLYDPVAHPNVPFGAYARPVVRMRIWRAAHLAARTWRVNGQMPVDRDGEQLLDPADHRRESEIHPALRAWCSEEYARQRRCLCWRWRVILYLRCVEGWTLDEVGAALRITRERVRQLEERAGRKLAAYRTRERIKRQLAGVVE